MHLFCIIVPYFLVMSLIDFDKLNKAQRDAVFHTEGPCLIIAGPGSGKTLVLTYRIAYLIKEKGVSPYRIMVLTFTRKAADEMKSRLANLLGSDVRGYWIGTFHSIFGRILRREAASIGFESSFSIYDNDDSKRLIKRIVKACNLDQDKYKPAVVLKRIAQAKRQRMDAARYAQDGEWQAEDEWCGRPAIATIYRHYEARCRAAQAMDYDDLLLNTYRLFYAHPAVLEKYQARFDYLLVDEFQDTDAVQYGVLNAIARKHNNLCAIGDDAQSIYCFRGADIRHILSFTDRYPQAAVFKLEKNYRSTKHIVTVANALIKHNEQHEKVLFTDNVAGNPVRIIGMFNELEEAIFVANSIAKVSTKQSVSYNDVAVLFRKNSQSRALEEALMRKNIPYQLLGSISFYQRKEIKDILAYLYLVVNPYNEEALLRAINEPKRSIGEATLAKVRGRADVEGIGLWDALGSVRTWMKGRTAERVQGFVALVNEHRAMLDQQDAYTLASSLVKQSGLLHQLRTDVSAEGCNRYENVTEFLQSIEHFSETHKEAGTLTHFVEEIALLTGNEQDTGDVAAKVKLMTIHKAKGLEFSHVYIVGMEENICPSVYAQESSQALEEDRRLFFVGITRAKEELTITYSEHHYMYGQVTEARPSRFLRELGTRGVVAYERSQKHPYNNRIGTRKTTRFYKGRT